MFVCYYLSLICYEHKGGGGVSGRDYTVVIFTYTMQSLLIITTVTSANPSIYWVYSI